METEFRFRVSWKRTWNSISECLGNKNGFPFPGVFLCTRTHVPRLKLKQDLLAKDLDTLLFLCFLTQEYYSFVNDK
jgi:hypothetical protein